MRKKTVIFFFLVIANIYPSFAANIFEQFNEANELILTENFSKAKNILKNILKKEPKNAQIINNIAYIEAKQGDVDKAIKTLRQSISNNKNIDIIYKNLTSLYAYQANILYEEALSIKDSEKNNINLVLVESLDATKNNPIVKNTKNTNIVSKNNQRIDPKKAKEFIRNWGESWENKNYQEYFSYYKKDYFPKKYKSRSLWETDRKNKIKNKKNIQVKISNIKVIVFGNKNVLLQFTQAYNSDSFSDVVTKHTTLVMTDNNFKITGEYILK